MSGHYRKCTATEKEKTGYPQKELTCMINENEFSALISLLDDEDENIYEHVSEKIISSGNAGIPFLLDAWEKALNPELQQRIEYVINYIQFQTTKQLFHDWVNSRENELFAGAMIISRIQFPNLNEKTILDNFEQIRLSLLSEMNDFMSPMERISVFNHIFYKNYRFNGLRKDYQDPKSYMLNYVIESRKGNALSLGIMYLTLAKKIGLPLLGIKLPDYFCLAYMKEEINDMEVHYFSETLQHQIIFYINPLNNGMILSKNEIKLYLENLSIEPDIKYFVPISNLKIIKTLIIQLQKAYELTNSDDKSKELEELLQML
jgi:regulator of sirC expression with transglutaminase-like and TPR domain